MSFFESHAHPMANYTKQKKRKTWKKLSKRFIKQRRTSFTRNNFKIKINLKYFRINSSIKLRVSERRLAITNLGKFNERIHRTFFFHAWVQLASISSIKKQKRRKRRKNTLNNVKIRTSIITRKVSGQIQRILLLQ